MKTKKRLVCDGKIYEKVNGKIKLGDLYYLAFADKVQEYTNINYGHFEPNKMGAFKVRLINK